MVTVAISLIIVQITGALNVTNRDISQEIVQMEETIISVILHQIESIQSIRAIIISKAIFAVGKCI